MPWIVLLLAAAAGSPGVAGHWLSDYGLARELAASRRLPLLLVFDTDEVPHGPARDDARLPGVLSAGYVCCRIDAAGSEGGRLAASYKVVKLPHTVIVDRSGMFQVFTHSGPMDARQWEQFLASSQPPPTRVPRPMPCRTCR